MKGDRGICKYYKGISLTAVAAKVYNILILNHVQIIPEKIPGKKLRCFLEKKKDK